MGPNPLLTLLITETPIRPKNPPGEDDESKFSKKSLLRFPRVYSLFPPRKVPKSQHKLEKKDLFREIQKGKNF